MIRRFITAAFVAAAAITAGAQEAVVADSTELTKEEILELELAQRKAELAERDAELAERDARLKEIEQEQRLKAIWKPGRFTKISYNISQTGDGFNPVDKSSLSVSLAKGASYLFPSRPIAGMLKIGFDITWFDFTFSKYKKPKYLSDDNGGWTSEIVEDHPEYDYGYDEDEYDFGRMSVNLGFFGIGPRVSIAPFSALNNQLRYLRASLYFHYQPTASAYLVSEDGEVEGSYAYLGMMRFGGCIHFRRIGIGVEGYWGKTKFDRLEIGDFIDEDFGGGSSDSKINRKFASTRIYLQFSF